MQEECENHPLIYDNISALDKKTGESIVKTTGLSLNDFSITVRVWAWEKNLMTALN
jgi:hypothetical protein